MPYAKAKSAEQLPQSIAVLIDQTHQRGKKIVLATGVFDVLHKEHKKFLQKAKKAGDFLIVGLESDVRVKQLKGPDRPHHTEADRLRNLEAWQIADAVFVLPEQFTDQQDYLNLVRVINPHILAVSVNTPHIDKKQRLMAMVDGEVKVVHEHNPAISTTQILSKA